MHLYLINEIQRAKQIIQHFPVRAVPGRLHIFISPHHMAANATAKTTGRNVCGRPKDVDRTTPQKQRPRYAPCAPPLILGSRGVQKRTQCARHHQR